jgi:nucleosome binding factor SPN SPT16 subunit
MLLTLTMHCYCLLLLVTTAMQQQPFFVVPLDDIEHVHFERVNPSGRNFDIKLILRSNVWNDGAVTEPLSINMVEQRYLHQIMNWLVVSHMYFCRRQKELS